MVDLSLPLGSEWQDDLGGERSALEELIYRSPWGASGKSDKFTVLGIDQKLIYRSPWEASGNLPKEIAE